MLCSPTRQSTNCPFRSLWRTRAGGARAAEIDDRRGCDRCSVIGASSQVFRLGKALLTASSESQLTESEPDDVYVEISEVCDDVASTEKTEEEDEEAEEERDD
jgi:hypothetical protein